MKISNYNTKDSGIDLPIIKITSSDASPNVIVIHGYGGNKEEQLGLSWRISNLGCNTFTVDLRGHGENIFPLSYKVQDDIDFLIANLKSAARQTIVIGHSLGGRLALLSKADYRIGISPALDRIFSEQTKAIINNTRKYRVREDKPDINFEILEQLPLVDSGLNNRDLILYGSRDVPEIVRYCDNLSKNKQNIIKVENALHGDIFLLEKTFLSIENHLKKVVRNNIV
jgi:hypothetical protein